MAIFTNEYCEYILYSHNKIEFSPEEIHQICESCKCIQLSISESYIIESAIPKINLDKLGIKNLDIKIKDTANTIANIIRSNGINSDTNDQIYNIISDFFMYCAKSIDRSVLKSFPNLSELNQKNLVKGITLTILDALINTMICDVLTLLLGPMGNVIWVCIAAPIVEESSKQIAVKGGFSKEYTIAFNTLEFSLYVSRFSGKIPIMNLIRTRALGVGMHVVNTAIHNLFNSDKFRKQFHIDNTKDNKDKCTFISFIICTLIHVSWNTASKFSHTFVKAITGLKDI